MDKEDLILLAEFDEVTGPRPLSWIPAQANQWLDLDAFCVKIMSVDTNTPSAREDSAFTVNEDSQLMLTISQVAVDSNVKVTAYVRHFTLYDLPARGFVRPMSLCYITASPDKIMKYFKEISSALFKASRLMKFGNQHKFLTDLDERTSDLKHTAELLNSKAEQEQEEARSQTEPTRQSSVHQQQASVKQALEDIRMVRNGILARSWDEEFKKKYRRHLNPTTWKQKTQRERKESSSGRDRAGTIGGKASTISTMPIDIPERGDSELGRDRALTFNTSTPRDRDSFVEIVKSPKYITGITKSLENSYQTKLQSVEELCVGFYRLAFAQMQKTLQCFRMDNTILLMHSDEAHLMHPGPHMLTIGRCSVMNFNVGARHVGGGGEGGITASHVGGHGGSGGRIGDELPRVASTQSLFAMAQSDHEAEGHPQTPLRSQTPRAAQRPYFSASGYPRSDAHSVKSTEVSARAALGIGKRDTGYVQSAGEHVALDSRYKPGGGLLRLREQCSFLPHIVYSLMSGRPVVVLAIPRNESAVRDLIRTLWLFVPGHSKNEKVISWRQSGPLQLVELNHVKLIGLSKGIPNALSKTVERFVTKIDFEHEIFLGSPYGKKASDAIFGLLMTGYDVPSESVLIAHVHAEFLRLSTIAFLYYHQICLQTTVSTSGPHATAAATAGMLSWTAAQRRRRKEFYKRHGLGSSDANIIDYLADVVKRQQIARHAAETSRHPPPAPIRPPLEEIVRIDNETGPIGTG